MLFRTHIPELYRSLKAIITNTPLFSKVPIRHKYNQKDTWHHKQKEPVVLDQECFILMNAH